MRSWKIMLAAATFMSTAPLQAGYVHTSYTGSVTQTSDDSPIVNGTPLTFDVVYDPDKFVDYTDSFNNDYGTDFSSVLINSLSDDPGASLTITAGGVVFTKYDQLNYGTPYSDCDPDDCGPGGLGTGNFPSAIKLNGAFSGVGNIFINADGFSLDADPIANYLISDGQGGGFGLDGPGSGDYDFFLGKAGYSSRGEYDPFHTGYAVGNIDLGTLAVAPVPEASGWAVMILGLGLVGGMLRARRRQVALV